MQPKTITEKLIHEINYPETGQTIEQYVAYLQNLPSGFPTYSNFRFESTRGYDYDYTALIGDRLETPKETTAREKRSAAARKAHIVSKARQKERQLKEFERLKKLLGK